MCKVMIFDMLNLNPKTDEKCQTLNAYNGTGGNNMPLILTFSKQKRAQSKVGTLNCMHDQQAILVIGGVLNKWKR